ncbi:MAG: LuxR family transcriptional regulator [Oscillospiraceae bacterium]|nr:LuxR family transcriptional regulator [Oscillospiraceae bacterium]
MVWLIEQLIRFDFEFLAISYIVTEMYLLSLYNMADDFYHSENEPPHPAEEVYGAETDRDVFGFIYDQDDVPEIKDIIRIWPAVAQLTTRETEVFCRMLMNRKRREIADDLCVSENTIKKHTSNIFTKLGVSSRAEIIRMLSVKNRQI